MLQATGYPAEIADFYSAISAGYWGVFLVAKTVQLVMLTGLLSLILETFILKDTLFPCTGTDKLPVGVVVNTGKLPLTPE